MSQTMQTSLDINVVFCRRANMQLAYTQDILFFSTVTAHVRQSDSHCSNFEPLFYRSTMTWLALGNKKVLFETE